MAIQRLECRLDSLLKLAGTDVSEISPTQNSSLGTDTVAQPRPSALVIAPRYFGYETAIARELALQGYDVDLLPDRPFNDPARKAIMRVTPELGYYFSQRFFAAKLSELGRSSYKLVLVILGIGVTTQTVYDLRCDFPTARFVFYTWDSIANRPAFKNRFDCYDECFSFDRQDCAKYGLRYRPLFFLPEFDRRVDLDVKYDMSFIGTVHSDRYRVVKKLISQLPRPQLSYVYFFIQASWMYDFRRFFSDSVAGATRSEFNTVPLAREEVVRVFFHSRIIIDVEHPRQTGATIRTFEALGSRRKLITTNVRVVEEEFFDPSNILAINRDNPQISADFISSPYNQLAAPVRDLYTIEAWVKCVAGCKAC